jgi:hypothetical protein
MSGINRLNNGGSIRLNNQPQHSRQTPDNSFGAQIGRGVTTGANAFATAANVAAPYVPGGSIVAATMNTAASTVGNYASGGTMNLPGQSPGINTQTGTSKPAVSSAQSLMDQTKSMQEMQMSFNLQYLNLQNKMQGENRQYSTISNVLKAKHETTKNSINNIR